MDERVLDRYRLERRLGSGGMAEVWLATDAETGGSVAVKRLHPHLASDERMVERFRREAAAAAAVRHPNSVRVLDASWREVILEYIAGETLTDRLRSGALSPSAVMSIGADLAGALAAVHAAGIVHRDVTPGNVIIDRSGRGHLSDFGIAVPLDALGALTATGDLVGTWLYVAPEVLDGLPASPASDVWSLGATLYEALAGRPPYPASSPAELVDARRHAPPPLAAAPWTSVVISMLHPDPARRPVADAVANALANVLASSPELPTEVVAAPGPRASTAVQPVTDHLPVVLSPFGPGFAERWPVAGEDGHRGAPSATPPTPAPSRRRRRGSRQVVLAAASALVAAGVALAAAAPAEPPAAAGVMPIGPFPVPSGSFALPTPTPTPRPATNAAVAPARTAAARQAGPKAAKRPKSHGKRGAHPKRGPHPGAVGGKQGVRHGSGRGHALGHGHGGGRHAGPGGAAGGGAGGTQTG